jgi:hypothetical protein
MVASTAVISADASPATASGDSEDTAAAGID